MLDYETIKKYYDKGFWTAAMVQAAVAKGKITQEQADGITGKRG